MIGVGVVVGVVVFVVGGVGVVVCGFVVWVMCVGECSGVCAWGFCCGVRPYV